jgi:hypothetical protein
LPIASDGGGDSICVDLSPDEGGTVGQIILMCHDDGKRPRLALSFAELCWLRWRDIMSQGVGDFTTSSPGTTVEVLRSSPVSLSKVPARTSGKVRQSPASEMGRSPK